MATSFTPVVPAATMSTQGFIFDSANKFDTLLAHLFATDGNQSYLYKGRIVALADMIEKVDGRKKDEIQSRLRQGCYNYFNAYYDTVGIEIIVTEINDSSSQLDFQLNITITEGLVQQQYGVLIRTVNKKATEIIKINNNGS
jgi:hypothetical protein